jgi:FAD/FMN-containing dehydrogenase
VVLADGRALDIGRGESIDFDPGIIPLPAVTKNTAGYLLRPGMDWVDLFCGSEGTLGVVTEARLRLLPAPCAVLAGVVFFATGWRRARCRGCLALHARAHARVSGCAITRIIAPALR